MYEGSSYVTIYCRRYHKNERKRKRKRRMLASMLAMLLTFLAVFTIHRIPMGEVQASPEANIVLTPEEAARAAVYENKAAKEIIEKITKAGEKTAPVIFVDAGHGGADAGCSRGGVEEKTINLAIAKALKTRLEAMGYMVIMSREGDDYISKEDRVKLANTACADIYISIHQNATDEGDEIKGMEVWYDGTDATRDNKRLAQLIKQQTSISTQAQEREIRGNADFHVTGSTKMPACLIETGFLTNTEERGKLASKEYQEKIAEGIAKGIDYYFHPKTMYLTFDDGPSEENTIRVLEILKDRDIKATFFLVGENVKQYPEIARRIVADGHVIGIHSDTHDYEAIYADKESFMQDLEAAHQIIYEVTGVDTKLVRFPGGSVNAYNEKVSEEIAEELTKQGYTYFDWNASLGDATGNAVPEQLVTNGVETTLGRKKVVMLAHDVVYSTGICLNDLLDNLPEYEMKAIDEDVEPIQF